MKNAAKKLQFYPEWSTNDEYVTEFLCSRDGNPRLTDTNLDPDIIKYSYPDFGYDGILSFSENEDSDEGYKGSGWRKFMDCVSIQPKFERVKQYINFVNQKKIEKLTEQQENTSQGKSKISEKEDKRSMIDKMRDAHVYKGLMSGLQV